jgi:hypothetical protein
MLPIDERIHSIQHLSCNTFWFDFVLDDTAITTLTLAYPTSTLYRLHCSTPST